MDNTVIILIGAGVSCVVIGFALFVKLAKMGSQEESEASGRKKLLADDYAENFQECFENTGNIEDTLEQLTDIYTGNQYMYNLIINALNFLKEDQGDYETALEGINVDSDTSILKMHNNAIKKALNIGSRNNTRENVKEGLKQEETNELTKNNKSMADNIVQEPDLVDSASHESLSSHSEPGNRSSFASELSTSEEDEYEEDEEEDEEEYGDAQELQDNVNTDEKRGTPSLKPGHKREKRAVEKEKNHEIESFEDDDLDDFKIG